MAHPFVGPVEETGKWAAVRLSAFDRLGFRTALDTAVYGAAAGLGFAIENVIDITRGLVAASQAGTPVLGATFATAAVRSLADPGHAVYTAFSGYCLGLAK